MSTALKNANVASEGEDDEDYASFLDLFSGMFFMMLLLVLMLFLLMGDDKSKESTQEKPTPGEALGAAKQQADRLLEAESRLALSGKANLELLGYLQQLSIVNEGLLAKDKEKGAEIEKVQSQLAALSAQLAQKPKPDFGYSIELSTSYFREGSADLPQNLVRKISSDLLPDLVAKASGHGYNTIEIIGHTDETPTTPAGATANDNQIASAMRDVDTNIDSLSYASNTELGIARALAVYRSIARFKNVIQPIDKFFVYSAGQYNNDGHIDLIDHSKTRNGSASRRKIEIRLTYTPGKAPLGGEKAARGAAFLGIDSYDYNAEEPVIRFIPIKSPAAHSGISTRERLFSAAHVTTNLEIKDDALLSSIRLDKWLASRSPGDIIMLGVRGVDNSVRHVLVRLDSASAWGR